jgi:hypothetical protein
VHDAVVAIRRRLQVHGPAPWSLCEARLSETDYQRLRQWAASVTRPHLDEDDINAGLVMLAFIAEWNRRNSPGGNVYTNLPQCFGVEAVKRRLFAGNNQPTPFLRNLLKRVCQRFVLRHAFGTEQEEDSRYYLSIQLQYGFSFPHAQDQLGHWIRGINIPKVAQRLLDPYGHYRSASFIRFVRDMKSYRRRWLPESDLRRTLSRNPWVLPTWEDEIVRLIDEVPADDGDDEPEFQLLSDPKIRWERGPEAWCHVSRLPDRLTAPRYVLRHAGRDIARYYRQCDGSIEPDRAEAQIPLDAPEAVVTLVSPEGETIELQTIALWNPEFIAQVRPVDREAQESLQQLLPGPQVLITPVEATVTPAPAAWQVMGAREHRRRWWFLAGATPLQVNHHGFVWNGTTPPSPPEWTSGVSLSVEPIRDVYRLGQLIRFRFSASSGIAIAFAASAGRPLSFTNATRAISDGVALNPEMAGKYSIRAGVTYGPDFAVIHREGRLPVRSVAWTGDSSEIPRNEPLHCHEAHHRTVRLMSNGPTVLAEGREIVGPLPIGRPARLKRVLGTGLPLVVANRPFNTDDDFQFARSAVDTGLARSLMPEGGWLRLRLFRPLQPNAKRRLILWSPNYGMRIFDPSEIAVEDGDRTWAFPSPWDNGTLLAAIDYEGICLATAWYGQERRFYDPTATDGLDVLTRVAMIRWCRLPALRPDPEDSQSTLIARLAKFPLEMARVALLDMGLPTDMGLKFAERQSPKGELFNVIFREAYLRPTDGDMAAVHEGLGDDFDRLIVYHPLLACRVLSSILPRLLKDSKVHTRVFLSLKRLRLLLLPDNTTDQKKVFHREEELLARACKAFSANGEPIDDYYVRNAFAGPVVRHLIDGAPLHEPDERNLRTALGVAPFREYLSAMIFHRLLERFG